MPFNMRHLRHPFQYNCPDGADKQTMAGARQQLARMFAPATRAALDSAEFQASTRQVPEPKLFVPMAPPDGSGRFRPVGRRLGIDARDNADVFLHNGEALWLRLMPQFDPGRTWSLTEVQRAMEHPFLAAPVLAGAGAFGTIRDEDGFGVYAMTNQAHEAAWVNSMFTNGEVWGLDTWRLARSAEKGTISVPEQPLVETLEQFETRLGSLGLRRPFRWIAGMEGVAGRKLWIPGNSYELWVDAPPMKS
jgi:hypothetical protein